MRYQDTPNNKAEQGSNLEAALALATQGFAIFPAGPDKRPLLKGWQEKATTDATQIERWWRKWPNAMPSMPTGQRNGVAVLDVDRKNGKDGKAALRELGRDPDTLSPVRVETPSGGSHILFRWPEGMGNTSVGLPAGVDVRGEGGFIIAPGAINGKGVYRLVSGSLTDDLPEWPKALMPRRIAVERGEVQPTGKPFHVILDALAELPNDGEEFASRDDWLKIGMALHAETGGGEDGNESWHGWSAQHPSYDPTATDTAWDSFKPGKGVTGGTIFIEAEKRGWRDVSLLDELWAEDSGDWKAKLEEDRAAWALIFEPKSRLTFLSPSECDDLPARNYIVKGLLGERDIAALVGAPGAGKSLLAPALGYAVARGVEAFGRRTRQGGVFYVAAEDSHGMRARIRALRERFGDAERFRLVEGVADLLSKGSEDRRALKVAVEDQRPSLIIIDTLAVAFPGLEENEAKAMSSVVAVARSLTKWGAAVVLVHHDTKQGDGLPRGHSILNGALDLSLHLKRDGSLVRVRPTKNRNGSTDQELAFSISTIRQGTDEDGDPIHAAICDEEDVAALPMSGKPLPASAKAALDILEDLLRGKHSIQKSDWRAACIANDAVSGAEDANGRRTAFRRALEKLAQRGLYVSDGEKIRLTESPEMLLGDHDV